MPGVLRAASVPTKLAAGIGALFFGYMLIRFLSEAIVGNVAAVLLGVAIFVAIVIGSFAGRHYYLTHPRPEEGVNSRHLAKVDYMDIPQFESWVAQLLLRDGFRKVRFVGRSGDFGSNFVATAPDSSKVVVRAKPDDGTLGRRGARHIQALGADARGKWQVDAAMLVTNANMHPVRTSARHDALAAQLGVVLIDRGKLASWVAKRQPPALTSGPARVTPDSYVPATSPP